MGTLEPARRARLVELEGRLQEWDFPPQVVLENTAFCNFRCVHCNHKELERPRGTMDEGLWRALVDEIAREAPATEVWPTFYGEAFVLGERLFERLRWARDRGLSNLVLNSNGSLLHRKDWIDQLLQCGLKRFILSLDGFSREVFEAIRVGGRRDPIYAAVERLLARKQELGLEYPVIQCQFSCMPVNQHELPAFKAFWEARGAEVKSRAMLSWTNSGSVVAENLDYAALEGEGADRIACAWGNNTMAVHWNGDVVACAVDYAGRVVVGNARHTSLEELWQGPLRQLRAAHRRHAWAELPALCRSCPDWQAVGATYHEPAATSAPAAAEAETRRWSRPFWHPERGTPPGDAARTADPRCD